MNRNARPVCKAMVWLSAVLVAVAVLLTLLTSCGNQQMFDTTYTFHTAVISIGDGQYIKGTVEGWKEFDGSEAVQIKINGKTYYTHLTNVLLINEG